MMRISRILGLFLAELTQCPGKWIWVKKKENKRREWFQRFHLRDRMDNGFIYWDGKVREWRSGGKSRIVSQTQYVWDAYLIFRRQCGAFGYLTVKVRGEIESEYRCYLKPWERVSMPRETRKSIKRAEKRKLDNCTDLAEGESAVESWK